MVAHTRVHHIINCKWARLKAPSSYKDGHYLLMHKPPKQRPQAAQEIGTERSRS